MSCYYLCDTCAKRFERYGPQACAAYVSCAARPEWHASVAIHDGQEPRDVCGSFEPLISKPRSEAAV